MGQTHMSGQMETSVSRDFSEIFLSGGKEGYDWEGFLSSETVQTLEQGELSAKARPWAED